MDPNAALKPQNDNWLLMNPVNDTAISSRNSSEPYVETNSPPRFDGIFMKLMVKYGRSYFMVWENVPAITKKVTN